MLLSRLVNREKTWKPELRANRAGISLLLDYTSILVGIEAIGFPTFGLKKHLSYCNDRKSGISLKTRMLSFPRKPGEPAMPRANLERNAEIPS